ncbi:unnamed protein product [Leptidea sinapis]|uniref:Uncharacterized protein n=1 Tax=Leptidea sinapis TaxID=189913 RepID=A0A5E4PYQ4_9NEOP|nr:unnamed protein product [Leptidea sinapis]
MDNNTEMPNDIASSNMVKTTNNGTQMVILRNGQSKRTPFTTNEAVKSLDIALSRLKKSKLASNLADNSCQTNFVDRSSASLGELTSNCSNFSAGTETGSVMSTDFSHFELLRDLSRSDCYSGGAFSSTACNNSSDMLSKDEHLEKYFRSIEMWHKNWNKDDTSNGL